MKSFGVPLQNETRIVFAVDPGNTHRVEDGRGVRAVDRGRRDERVVVLRGAVAGHLATRPVPAPTGRGRGDVVREPPGAGAGAGVAAAAGAAAPRMRPAASRRQGEAPARNALHQVAAGELRVLPDPAVDSIRHSSTTHHPSLLLPNCERRRNDAMVNNWRSDGRTSCCFRATGHTAQTRSKIATKVHALVERRVDR